MSYIGKGLLHGSYIHDSFNGDGSTVNFTLSTSPGSANALLVMVDNVLQSPSAFSVDGTTLTFSSAPAVGTDNIRVWIMGRELDIGKPAAATVGTTEMANGRLLPDYIKLTDTQTSGTNGGAFTSGSWVTRVLNTENTDTGSFCSLASNQFTLQPGTYLIKASAPAYKCNRHKVRLYDVDNVVALIEGTSEYADATGNSSNRSSVQGEFTLSVATTLELQHQCSTTRATDGLGVSASFGNEVYAVVELWKVK